jgi:hypothetical protein
MVCDILDLKCIFVNEIVGSTVLAIVLGLILYFIIASKNRFGFDTTVTFLFPVIFIFGLAITGFSIIFAFATIIIGLMVAWIFNKLIGNR